MSSQLDLTKREKFALSALQGLLSSPYALEAFADAAKGESQPKDVLARAACQVADALIKELEKKES